MSRLIRHIVGPVLGVSVVAYFAYYTVQGDRGILALQRLKGEVAEADMIFASLAAERAALENRTRLLRPDNLDPDMLEERARLLLNFSHPDDLIVLLPGRPAPHPAPAPSPQAP